MLHKIRWYRGYYSSFDYLIFLLEVYMRRFEIIDRDAFIRDIPNGNYDDVVLPKRGTISSAGYDFYSVISVTLKPGERKVIPTGIRVMMNNNEFLGIFIRSSL